MTARQLSSRQKLFDSAGIKIQFVDFISTVQAKIQEVDGECNFFDSKMLKTVFQEFRDQWLELLTQTSGSPDKDQIAEAYSWPYYMTALYECFFNWTIRSTANVIKFTRDFGYTGDTFYLSDGFSGASCMHALAFPDNMVYAHIIGAKQLAIATELKKALGLNNMVITDKPYNPAGNLVCLEVLEHFKDPMSELSKFLTDHVKLFIHSSPWRVQAHGHYSEYTVNGSVQRSDEMPKLFGRYIKDRGFMTSVKAHKFRFYNGDPEIYVKIT